jgi:hypothetical protein
MHCQTYAEEKKEFIEIQGVINVQNSIVGGSYQFSVLPGKCCVLSLGASALKELLKWESLMEIK